MKGLNSFAVLCHGNLFGSRVLKSVVSNNSASLCTNKATFKKKKIEKEKDGIFLLVF